jgi:predicted SAM-dependent methyltransferase
MLRALRTFVKKYPFRSVKRATSRLEIGLYYRQHAVRLLNIGAQGNHPKGWLSVDIEPGLGSAYLDASDMSALGDASFDAVLCEHMIEHIPKPVAAKMCAEIHRILKPRGVARFVTPDLARLARAVLDPGEAELAYVAHMRTHLNEPQLTVVEAVNVAFREYGHQYLYTRDELRSMLEAAGFRSIVETTACGFGNELFRDAQGHGRLVGDELNELESFALECSP